MYAGDISLRGGIVNHPELCLSMSLLPSMIRPWIRCCSKAVNERIGKAQSALHGLDTIWKSEFHHGLKTGFLVEMVLLCASTAWTLTQSLDEKLDGACTQMLRVMKNETWRQCITNSKTGSRPQLERGTLGSTVIAGGVERK